MLSVRDLRVSFRTEQGLLQAIDGVSFDVEEGEILGVVGESGSGKTVSLLAVMGLINDPNAVIEGSIKYRGRELVGLPAAEMRKLRGREIAMIFQDPMTALTPVYTIGWQIAEQILAHEKIGKAAARQRAIDLLAEVNIPNPQEAVDRYPHQLSGGMRQRAVIAMALSCNPALLVADEPTTALDVTVQAQILDLVRKLQRNPQVGRRFHHPRHGGHCRNCRPGVGDVWRTRCRTRQQARLVLESATSLYARLAGLDSASRRQAAAAVALHSGITAFIAGPFQGLLLCSALPAPV